MARLRAVVLVLWMALLFLASLPAPVSGTLTPLRQGLRLVGASQGWTMFGGVDREPVRLQVEVQEQGAWRLVHQTGDPEHAWNLRQLSEARVRSTINLVGKHPRKHRKRWQGFTDWLATRALEDFPEATAVRFSMREQATPAPADLRQHGWPEGRVFATRSVSR